MPKRLLTYRSILVLAAISLLLHSPAQTPKGQSARAAGGIVAGMAKTQRPKLIVILVIDQFRSDYLVRFRQHFLERGFNLLLSGANFIDCRYHYATTATCPGPATLLTGAYHNVHGIIANDWYDPRRYRRVYCAEDPDTRLVGGSVGPGFSPRKLMVSTLGDELRMATDFQSKVIAISLKDRASTIPGGHTANAAYWYDVATGHFVSSTYYMQALPRWAAAFNDPVPAKAYCGKAWQALPETPGAKGRVLKQFTPDPNETCPDGKFIAWLDGTPFMNQIELDFALAAVKNERLGQGPAPDLLTLSLSVNDSIGHEYGPYSAEVADTTLRTDRDLADFFRGLDQALGLDNIWIILTADHGVAPSPNFSIQHRLLGPQAPPLAIWRAVEHALSEALGRGPWVQDLDDHYISLNPFTLKDKNADLAKAEMIAAAAASSVPGVRAAFTRTQLLQGPLPDSPLARMASNSFNEKRSGDVFLISDPYVMTVPTGTRTSHGEPWNYDAQVPLILWGSAFKPGTYATPCETIDMVPTLAVALGLTQPSGAQGQPLASALK